MKTIYLTPVVLAVAALLGACGSTSKSTSLLDQSRADYVAAQNNPKVADYAALELKLAGDALAKANTAASGRDSAEQIDKLAYLALQKIALTQEVAKQKSAEADVANATRERDQIRLTQRTNEADKAIAVADQAKLDTSQAQADAAQAERSAQEARARAAQLEAQLTELSAKKTERGIVIVLGDLLFGTDLARLNAEGMRTTQKLADVLQQNPQRRVLVEGFTDSTGTTAHNQDLSERRAAAVQAALKEFGVDTSRVAARGYGESNPVAANDTGANRRLNRRVEIFLSDENGKIVAR
jgi:outer membrane protein OmpA-like peptidoglycan-associated protein